MDRLRQPEPRRYIVGVTGTLAILAVASFLTIFLIGSVGGTPVVPDGWDDADDETKDEYQKAYTNAVTNRFVSIAPFLALGFVGLAGGAIGSRLDRSRDDTLATAAVASFAGAFVFLLLAVFLASTQYSSLDHQALGLQAAGSMLGNAEQSVEFVTLLVDSVITGIAGALAGAGGAFLGQME